ncbi:rhotekin isoform X4 [Parasteatoda tepidariorum]|uniref:rhotekin isoform X3 n=1 Tax=Parasteatoda tepidariorum TaxID=114398 RepID=UPI00077F85AA|nr:rhotekin isoform X3 [Parasteatoda tepidariorum]
MPRYIYALWQKSVHFCDIDTEEYDLEQKIDLEIKMQEGTNKLLAACRYQLQSLEAIKSLLTSNERINSYMFELQRRKSLKQNSKLSQIRALPCRGKVAISDIRMPLIWKDSDHFKNRGDYRRFAVFCLLKVGTEVQDTAMINNVDRSMTDIAFEDVILFNNVSHDFEFRLEVYSHVLQEDLSIASASNKLKKKISYSVSRAIGKRFSENYKEDLNFKTGFSEFDLVASAKLNLNDANSRIKTYDLNLETPEKSQLPLFGHFCCRLAVQPTCMIDETYSGYLSLVNQIGNITGCRRMLASLKNFSLSMWANFAEVHSSNPDIVIPVKTGTIVTPSSKAISYPRFSFKIEYSIDDENKEFLLAADSPIQLNEWLNHINQQIKDYDLWKPASESIMEISSPCVCRNSQFTKHRNSSLYDETPFIDESECSSGSYGSASSVFQKNNHRVSTPPFCSLSSSSSSTNSSLEYQQHPLSKSLYRRSVSAYFPSFFHS